MSKIKIGIDINEVLRARWLQFDRFYVQEFGEENVLEDQSYIYDLFKEYKWEDVEEIIKELKEPDDMPEDINPLEYQVNENGEADADIFLFKKTETIKLTAKELYNRFMYEDYVFEIHASAPLMYKGIDLDVNNFLEKYSDTVDFIILSVENKFSIPPTLFFLSKMTSRFKNIRFVDDVDEMWDDDVDLLITTNPEIFDNGIPENKKVIKLQRPYNENCSDGIFKKDNNILQLNDLNGNEEFEKIINYNPKK